MSAIAAYAVEAETAKELKKGQFKLYHQKTPPTNVVLLDIHDTDTEEVKYVKGLINQMRQELGSSTDLIKIEPETALFNILYTKKEVDQLVVSTGAGFNLPMFLSSVLLAGAVMIKLRSDGERVTVERYQEFAENTLDNFDYVARKFNEYAEKFKELNAQINDHDDAIAELTGELYNTNQNVANLTERVDVLEDTVSYIDSCQCDKKWMRFMKQNFQEGEDDEEIEVKGNLNLNGNAISGLTEMTTHGGVLNINGSLYVPNHPVTARNLPAELTFRHNGLKQNDYITDDGVVDYNTYGKWFQPCDIEAFGSIDVDNRLRINTLNDNKTSIIKTVDVGATLENHEERIEALESGGGGGGGGTVYKAGNGIEIKDNTINALCDNQTIAINKDNRLYVVGGSGGDGFWKINPTHMQSLPEHPALETYDFNTNASNVQLKQLDKDYLYVYFPDLTVDLSYDRAQFIEIKSAASSDASSQSDNPARTWYLSTKDGKMEFPAIIDYQTLQEETITRNDNNYIGMMWKKQIINKTTTVDGKVTSINPFYQVYYETKYKDDYLIGYEERPLTITLQEYNSSKELYRTTSFILTDEFDQDHEPIEACESKAITLNVTGDPALTNGLVYYINGLDTIATFSCKWVFSEYGYEVPVDELINRIREHKITFTYTPDRDKIINNEPVTITSTELVKNDTAIIAPNAFDLHKYGGVKNYEVRLDKLINDGDSVASYNKITFKDFHIGGDYVGPVFTIYFGTTRFMMNNEQILTPISCYFEEDGTCSTDKLYKKDGFWTTERVTTDVPCFLWSKTCPITLQDAYNTGEITIKYIPRQSTMSTEHDVICREILADNAMELYRATTANFYNPKIITEITQNDLTYYVIDFGYSEDSEEFNQLPEGFRFRFRDPVFSYNYEAVKENNRWNFKYGNLHPSVNTNRFRTNNFIDFSGQSGNILGGPCIIMNNSNEMALTYLVKHCLGHNVSGWENMWKALWTDSRAKITINGPVKMNTNKYGTTKKKEGQNQYCYVTIEDNGTAERNKSYPVSISLIISTDVTDVNLKFEYTYTWTDVYTETYTTPGLETVYDCYEVLNFSQHKELTFEYSDRGRGLRFYASPDFLLWDANISYEKGTNIFRFLYDRDYVQIEPRPESCSALMTNKNIITDGIVVAQNLETHLHSLNQVANVSEETIQRLQYTDAVLGEIISNLAALNDFVRITILADFISLGFTGLMGIVKFGEGVMKNGLRSTLRLDEMPAISTAMRSGNRYLRIGEETSDLVQDARAMELVARDSIRSEAETISSVARDITEEATSIERTAANTIRDEADVIETHAMRQQHITEEDFSLMAQEFSAEASEVSISSHSSASFSALEEVTIESERVAVNSNRTTFGQLLEENTPLLTIDGDRAAMIATYGRNAGDYILGLFNRAGAAIRNGSGIVFNSAKIASLLENMWWIFDTYKDAIGWSIQFGTNIYKLIEVRKLNDGLDVYFTPDRFTWSILDEAKGIITEHTITGIAKYNEMSSWNDQKLITGQALLENYYSKGDIDSMLANNGGANGAISQELFDERTLFKEEIVSPMRVEPVVNGNTVTWTASASLNGRDTGMEIDFVDGTWVVGTVYIDSDGNVTYEIEDGNAADILSVSYDDSTFTRTIVCNKTVSEAYAFGFILRQYEYIPIAEKLTNDYYSKSEASVEFLTKSYLENSYYNKTEVNTKIDTLFRNDLTHFATFRTFGLNIRTDLASGATLTFVNNVLNIDKGLTVSGDIKLGDNQGLILQNNGYSGRMYLASNGKSLYFVIGGEHKYLWRDDGSQTITHHTNVIGEIGTFCESNGKIYDGYEKIGETDCICQVKQSKSLNKKIIGIITSETQFASHGDVLVKVNDISDCSVGDILVPDENGCGKVASEQDLMFMMLHAIPRPKITSLNTGIDGMVACFIV